MKFAFFDTKPYDKAAFEKNNTAGIEFKYFEARLTPDTAPLAAGCDGVCIFVNDIASAEVIDILYNLGVRAIALRCAGYNNVDLKHARGKLAVFHVPAYSPHAVAEHAMAMLLTFIRKTHKAYIRTKDHNFSLVGLTGVNLYGKTIGVIGTGRIGRVFVDICKGFGMNVIAYDKFPDRSAQINYVSKDELFEQSDIISLHCPLTEETRHIINEETLTKLKSGVIIINTSRGALIDTKVLLDGIKSRRIGGACLDVYEEESELFFEDRSEDIISDDTISRLISMPNVLVTSHQAFLTENALDNIAETTIKNILSYFKSGYCENELCSKTE